jgi:hypothetical protein
MGKISQKAGCARVALRAMGGLAHDAESRWEALILTWWILPALRMEPHFQNHAGLSCPRMLK